MAKVLLVDDEELVRKVVRVVLEADGHDVVEAVDGGQAISLMQHERPDVVVLDLMLPGEDGISVCRKLKAIDASAPVLVLSAVPEAEAAREVAAAGADAYMLKPFSSLELIRRIAEITA